jgi:hypothetical protein
MGTKGTSPGVKRGRDVTLTTHPHLVPRSRMSRSYTSSPLISFSFSLFNDAFSVTKTIQRWMLLNNDEVEKIWKEAVI